MTVSFYNNNKPYYAPNFKSEKIEAGVLTKPIETVQKPIETVVDAFVATPNEDEKKKKMRKKAIAAGSAVLVLGAITMILNPRGSGKFLNKLKSLQSKLDIKLENSKNSFLKSKLYGSCKKLFGVAEKGGHIYFNINSGKDIIFQSLCINKNKKYPKFLTKNKTVYKIVKAVDDFFVKIFNKPHKKITEWFDKISQWTVKKKYKNALKKMDVLESILKNNKDKLPADKVKILEAKLEEIAVAKKAFSEPEILKRLGEQEKLMTGLSDDLWKNIYNKKDGFAKNPTNFWVQDALKTQKTQVEENGATLIENLIGGKGKKGLYDDAIELFKNHLDKKDLQIVDDNLASVTKKLKKANISECSEYFDKKRDLVVGGAPTDIVTQIGGVALCGLAVTTADKEEKLQKAFTTGLPIITGLGSSLVFSALLYSGGVGLLAGAAVSGVTTIACHLIDKYVFGNKSDGKKPNKEQKNNPNNPFRPQEVNYA